MPGPVRPPMVVRVPIDGAAHLVEAGPTSPDNPAGVASLTDCGVAFDHGLLMPASRRAARGLPLCAGCDAEDGRRYGPHRHSDRMLR